MSSANRGQGQGPDTETKTADSRRAAPRGRIPQSPPSKPAGTESETFGRIHRMLTWLDANKGAFAISRLISQTGQNLRGFTPETRDDPRLLSKLWPLLDVLLSADEKQALMKALRDGEKAT